MVLSVVLEWLLLWKWMDTFLSYVLLPERIWSLLLIWRLHRQTVNYVKNEQRWYARSVGIPSKKSFIFSKFQPIRSVFLECSIPKYERVVHASDNYHPEENRDARVCNLVLVRKTLYSTKHCTLRYYNNGRGYRIGGHNNTTYCCGRLFHIFTLDFLLGLCNLW